MAAELHEEGDIQDLAALLDPGSRDERRAVILSGKLGGGRSSLADAAIRRLREKKRQVLFSRVDLDGYEPDTVSPQDYLALLASKREDAERDAVAAPLAEKLAASAPISVERFALLAIVAGRDAESGALVALAEEALTPDGVDWSRLTPHSDAMSVVVHIADSAQLPALLRSVLLELEPPGLRIVLSCDTAHATQSVVGARASARFELLPMDLGEVRFWLTERFGAKAAEDADAFHSACGGSRELLAFLAAQSGPPRPPSVALEELASSCDDERRKTLQAFLVHSALCGENIPVKTILEYLGADAEALDDWVDLIDETVGDDSEARVFASRFSHPSFEGETVYGFRESAWRARLLLAVSDASRRQLAQQFAAWLFRNRPLTTRAAARLMVELCLHGDIGGDRLAIERELAWWAGDGDLDALRRSLVQRPPRQDDIWVVVNAVQTYWPPQRTLALLDAAKESGLAQQVEGALHTIRAGLLLRLERFEEAAVSAEAALAVIDKDPLLESVLLEQRGSARHGLGRDAEAFADFERCRALRLKVLKDGDARVVPLLERSLHLLRQSGRVDEAAAVEKALAEHAARKAN